MILVADGAVEIETEEEETRAVGMVFGAGVAAEAAAEATEAAEAAETAEPDAMEEREVTLLGPSKYDICIFFYVFSF